MKHASVSAYVYRHLRSHHLDPIHALAEVHVRRTAAAACVGVGNDQIGYILY